MVETIQQELYPEDDHFLPQYSKRGEIKFPFDVVPHSEEVQPPQTPKVTAPLP